MDLDGSTGAQQELGREREAWKRYKQQQERAESMQP